MSSSAKVEEFGEGFDVSFGDAAAVGADDAGGEGGVVQVLWPSPNSVEAQPMRRGSAREAPQVR